ncbi:MAG: DEAD/DEAH box helicase [Oscillospiraceae bacterium]|nr:DEAD/DEAH box helicase [Oscillospiraceae bacterium]
MKRARASAKEIEFNVPDDLKSKKDVNIDELFPLAIACIADLSSGIIRQEIPIKQVREYSKELYFASKFYDAYTYINENEQKYFDDNNYFYLVGAIAYYLCDQVGSSSVLAQKVNLSTLNLSHSKLDVLLYHILINNAHIENNSTTNPYNNDYTSLFIRQYNQLMTEGADIDYKLINSFRKYIYDQNNFRDIFLIDALLAIFILKSEYSIFSMLPMYSNISRESLVNIVKSNHFVRELWPSQRLMCESGLFNGKSGVIQMPTGAGKTKSLSIAIYSSFCSEQNKLSVVVAPFRALCREIYDDLKADLCFDNNIKVNQISDLLQIDYVIEEFFNPNKKTIIVTTPEKLLYILRQDESIVNNIGQLIFDEGHLFDDEERGANYELLISSIISELNPNIQKILISAILPNVDEINKWFTDNHGIAFTGNSIAMVDKLPAVLKWEQKKYCYLYFLDETNKNNYDFYVPRMIEVVKLNKKKGERKQRYFPDVDQNKGIMNETYDMSIACLLKVVSKDNAAIFCGTKTSANGILDRIIQLNDRGLDVKCLMDRANESEINKLSRLIDKNYGDENPLYMSSKLGVFAHHAGVSEGIKNAIEYALRKELITNVVCTSTLAQGVNLPIKYLIVSNIYQGKEKIKVRDFQNLIGRTARSGMFTEGTIIFSDPFVFKNRKNYWKWNDYKKLLEPSNSEKCGSTLLEIIRPKKINKSKYDFYQIITTYYTDKARYEKVIQSWNKPSDEQIIKWFNHVIRILANIEGFISLALIDLNYSEELIDALLMSTLANSLATDDEKKQLHELFKLICTHVLDKFPKAEDKRAFSRSWISSYSYIEMKKEIDCLDINEIGTEKMLDFSIQMVLKYYPSVKIIHKIETIESVIEIAKMWMNGDSYYLILKYANKINCLFYRGEKLYPVSLNEIVSLCGEDFGYASSIIINSICEIMNQRGDDTSSECVIQLQNIMQGLKYGLHDRTSILVYELGFNDRYLSQEIAKLIGACHNKNEAMATIKKKKREIKELLNEYPSVFLSRLENI